MRRLLFIFLLLVLCSPAHAQTKISQLPATTAVTGDDLLVTVDDPSGTPVTKKITVTNFAGSLFGFTPENAASKDGASGYAGLDASSLLKAAEFPAFTGDATKPSGSLVMTVAKVNGSTPGGTCTNQFVRSLSSSAVPTCASVDNASLSNSSVTIGSTPVSLGSTASTVAGLTLTTPTIGSFTNATHGHTNAAGGGQLAEGALSLSDVTTNNATSSAHGFMPKLSGSVYDTARGDGTYARTSQVLFLYASATGTGNSGTGETDLQTYTLPAGLLSADGKTLRITVEASTANNANSKALRVYFGSTVIGTPQNGTSGNGMAGTLGIVARTGATTQLAILRNYLTTGGNEGGNSHVTTTPAETMSGTIVIKVTGQSGTASNDVVLKFFMIELLN